MILICSFKLLYLTTYTWSKYPINLLKTLREFNIFDQSAFLKPVIQVVRRTASGAEVTWSMSFMEAIIWVKVDGLSDKMDQDKARERAGASFQGTLIQHFVLM